MNNIYFLFLFYQIYIFILVKAIYIPYGQLECDIIKTLNQKGDDNNYIKWKKAEENIDENDVYSNIINKLYKECLVEQPLKNIKHEKDLKEIFEKEREIKEKQRNGKFTVNNLFKSNYSNKDFGEQVYIINKPYHYNLNQIIKWYLPVSYIDITYEKEIGSYVGFLDILQDSLILKKEINEDVFIYQSLCLKKTYEQIFLLYDENELNRISLLDLDEEEHRSNRDNSHSQRHLRTHFNRFVSNNKDQEWTNKLFKMDDDNIMNWPTKFYNEIIKVFNFSDKNKEEKDNEEQDELISDKYYADDSRISNNNNNNNNNNGIDNSNNNINNNNSNNNNLNNSNSNGNIKKANEFNKESTLEKLKEMEDFVHYQEKFSGNTCRNKYYHSNNEEYFKRLFDQKLICPIRLEDKLKIKSNEKNKNGSDNVKSNGNNNNNRVIDEAIKEKMQTIEMLEEIYSQKNDEEENIMTTIYPSHQKSEEENSNNYSVSSSKSEEEPMETPSVTRNEDNNENVISSIMEEKVTATATTLYDNSYERREQDKNENEMQITDDNNQNISDNISSTTINKENMKDEIPTEEKEENKVLKEKDTQLVDDLNEQEEDITINSETKKEKEETTINPETKKEKEEITVNPEINKEKEVTIDPETRKEEVTINPEIEKEKEEITIENEDSYDSENEKSNSSEESSSNDENNDTVENIDDNMIKNKNETESDTKKINTSTDDSEEKEENNNDNKENENNNSEHKNRFFSFFLRSGNGKDKKPKPPPSMEDDIIYSVKDLKLTGKEHFNFASLDCAATVLKSNPELKMANAILNESKDSYSNNICQAKEKFVIIELCEDILIDRIILGNFEYFSSMYKDIKVSISSRYPPKDGHWKLLAFLRATNSRDIQVFKIKNPISYVKYVRFDFLSYYGYEYFCPLSLIRIHGRTMMDEFIEDEGKLEEEIVIETPPYPYLQPGHPFLTLPSTQDSYESNPFEEAFSFLSSDSFLRGSSSGGKVRASHTTSHSKTSTSSSSSTSKGDNSDKGNANINLFSLFIKQYSNQLITDKNDYMYDTSPTRSTRQTKTNPSTATTPENIEEEGLEEETTNDSNSNDSNDDDDDDDEKSQNNDDYDQPHLHESVFKTIMRRLTALERNTTLSFKYLEEQGKIFNQYILYLHKKQQSSLKQLIEDNNMMYDNNLHALKNEFDSNWKEMWNELQINKQIYYDTIKQIAFKIENIEQSYDNRMFALLLVMIFNKLIWIIIKKMWSLLFRFSSKSKKRSSISRVKHKNDYYYIESDDSMSSFSSLNTPNFEEFIRRKSPLSNNMNYSSSSINSNSNTPPAKLKRKKILRKTPSYTNSVHMNRYDHINNYGYHTQGMGHIHSRTSSSTGSSRRNSSVEFTTNDLLRKSQRLPPQTSSILASASSALQAKKILHNLYHQKPPLSPTSIRYNKRHEHSVDNADIMPNTIASGNANNSTNANSSSNLNGILKTKHHYQSPRPSINVPKEKMKEKEKEKEKNRVNDDSNISSQSDEEEISDINENKNYKGKLHNYNPSIASSSNAHRQLHVTLKENDHQDDKESEEEREETEEEKVTHNYSPTHDGDNEKTPTTTNVKGNKTNSLTINPHVHAHSHSHSHGHSSTKNKLSSSPTSTTISPSNLLPLTTDSPSSTVSSSHRSGVRPPSIITNKLGLPSTMTQNTTSALNKARTLDYPVSTPVHTNHPTSVVGSAYPPSSVSPLHLHNNGDPASVYANMLLSSLSPTSAKERGHSHRNYTFLGNKHILRRKKTNLVRSPASFPSLSRMNN